MRLRLTHVTFCFLFKKAAYIIIHILVINVFNRQILKVRFFVYSKMCFHVVDSFSKLMYNILVIFRLTSVYKTTALLKLQTCIIYIWRLSPDLAGLKLIPRYDPSLPFL